MGAGVAGALVIGAGGMTAVGTERRSAFGRGGADRVTHPAARASRTTTTPPRTTSVLRRRITGRRRRQTAKEIRRNRPPGHSRQRWYRRQRRVGRLSRLLRHAGRRGHGACGNARRLRPGGRRHATRFRRVPQTHVHLAVRSIQHHVIGPYLRHGPAGDAVAQAVTRHSASRRIFKIRNRSAVSQEYPEEIGLRHGGRVRCRSRWRLGSRGVEQVA